MTECWELLAGFDANLELGKGAPDARIRRQKTPKEDRAIVHNSCCPHCQGRRGQWRGFRKSKQGIKKRRRYCTQCRRWFSVKIRGGD